MTLQDLAGWCPGNLLQFQLDRPILTLVTDSRKVVISDTSVFIAITGHRNNGHHYLPELYRKGIRQFIIEEEVDLSSYPDANIFHAAGALEALHTLVKHHRQQFNTPVVGITGSNGKTIVKEWLSQVLDRDHHLVKNPGSYNSQLGVPLAVWQMQAHHDFAIFEAGISKPGEMAKLETIIRPTLGIFTNLGSAHDEGFSSREEKAKEKALLFVGCSKVIYCRDHELVAQTIKTENLPGFSWGTSVDSDVRIIRHDHQHVELTHQQHSFSITLPVTDPALQEDALHVVATMLLLGYSFHEIQERLRTIKPVAMRLELKQGINRCALIDDTYNNDLGGLSISLDFLRNQQKRQKILILSDLLQTGLEPDALASALGERIRAAGVSRFIGVGPFLHAHQHVFPEGKFYSTTEELLKDLQPDTFSDAVVLVKGARPFHFERIVARLQRKVHGTVMEVDLSAMIANLNYFKSLLKPGVKLMAMVKAFAYGSGSEEVANLLQYHRVDYLGVAYADEGVELRKNNITLPIMVMNPTEESFDVLLEYHLEPEIYSLRILRGLLDYLGDRPCRIHLKLDTGMHRLGFESMDLNNALDLLKAHPRVEVASIFSHLSGADEKTHDGFTREQAFAFKSQAELVQIKLGYCPIMHLLNSSGILRFPDYQFDMVRLGIGLYGVDPTETGGAKLQPVATLKTIISQLKRIPAGHTIGYGRKGKADKDMTLATIAIGYADGFSRAFSQGKGKVLIQGQLAPVVGNVCMDMTMVDVTGMSVREGDEAIVFGPGLPIHQVAQWGNTIPYEILTNTSERVKRVFYAESI